MPTPLSGIDRSRLGGKRDALKTDQQDPSLPPASAELRWDELSRMLAPIDPVEDSNYGLAGGIHKDYRSEIVRVEQIGPGWRRIFLRLVDDGPKPVRCVRRPILEASVIVPEELTDYSVYRRELRDRIERGADLTDIAA
jgi:hypothetical protein